jgi:hypothetical protein
MSAFRGKTSLAGESPVREKDPVKAMGILQMTILKVKKINPFRSKQKALKTQ